MKISVQQESDIAASMSLFQRTEGDGDGISEQTFGIEYRMVTGGWEVTMSWLMSANGGPEELTIKTVQGAASEPAPQGITVDILRSIPLAQISREAMAMSSMVQRMEQEDFFSEVIGKMVGRIRHAAHSIPRPGRAGRSEEFFAIIAALYSWYVLLGYSNPVRKIEGATGCNWRAVANWVRLAREKGMLAEATPCRPGGILTGRAMQIIESEEHRFSELLGQYLSGRD
jgi:hypothetical protein